MNTITFEMVQQELWSAAKLVSTGVSAILTPVLCRRLKRENNSVLFICHMGKRTDCNPRAIYEYLQDNYPGEFHCVWATVTPETWPQLSSRADTELVKWYTLSHLKNSYSAKVVVSNNRRQPMFPGREDQAWIGTWHGGGCYKSVASGAPITGPLRRRYLRMQAKLTSYFISSSKWFSENVLRNEMLYEGEILPIGMPRNDRLIRSDPKEAAKARGVLGVSDDKLLVVYAPTWQAFDDTSNRIDVSALKRALRSRFGRDVVAGLRSHHRLGLSDSGFDLDLSSVEDVQDVLMAADVLISNYSSIIWDYSFTYKPCFLFAPDLPIYEKRIGLGKDIREWGFPVAECMDELIRVIESFDQEDFEKAMMRHHDDLGSYEDGHATERVADLIHSICYPDTKRKR